MRPPEGLDMRITGRHDDMVTVEVTVREVIHACPPIGSGVMPCCERTPTEMPMWDRLTVEPDLVTCGGHGDGERDRG